MENSVAMADAPASAAAAAGASARAPLSLADFVADDQPSAFLKLSMSRRVKEALIAEPKLRAFLLELVASEDESAVQRVAYGASARRVVLVEFSALEHAVLSRQRLHSQPCALLQGRAMYAEFALPRKTKEARDQLQRVPSVSRALARSDPSTRVPGLQLRSEFVSEAQERALLAFLGRDGGAHWQKTVRARQVQHFGFTFNYDTRRCDVNEAAGDAEGEGLAMPPLLQQLVQQIADAGAMDGDTPDQVTVNEYLPGQGIAAHIDTHAAFTTSIASLSLESEIVMEFRRPGTDGAEPVLLPPRSLVVMTGASRYEWTHAIQPRAFDVIDGARVDRKRRLSITFRKVQTTPCSCAFPVQCAAQDQFEQQRLRKLRLPREEKQQQEKEQEEDQAAESLAPTTVEQQYVHEFYETVADHFSSTRYNPWPRVKQFVQSLPLGSVLADLGCGNGKYMLCVDPLSVAAVGGDRSARLAHICGARGLDALVCDALRAPLRSSSCDAALSIAVLHHLSTEHHRVAAVKELVRVLRVGGRGVVYAWAHEQQRGSRRRFEDDRQDFMVPWNLDKRFARKDRDGESDAGDQAVKDTATVVQRFCHMFKQGELEQLVALAGGATVEDSYYDESNWAVVIRRVS